MSSSVHFSFSFGSATMAAFIDRYVVGFLHHRHSIELAVLEVVLKNT